MAKILVLYYSSYGHLETMAGAVAAGSRAGGHATVEAAQKAMTGLKKKAFSPKAGSRDR